MVPKVWRTPPPPGGGGAQEIRKGGARSAKQFYSQKINTKHKHN
jgi:hypothetical protein